MKLPAPEPNPVKASGDDPLVYICDAYRHLVCTPFSIENLHRMARELGIHRGWFHGGKHPHYDIPKRRVSEIMSRCRVVSSRDILKILLSYGNTDGDRR